MVKREDKIFPENQQREKRLLVKLGEKNGKLVIKKQTYLLMVKREKKIGL